MNVCTRLIVHGVRVRMSGGTTVAHVASKEHVFIIKFINLHTYMYVNKYDSNNQQFTFIFVITDYRWYTCCVGAGYFYRLIPGVSCILEGVTILPVPWYR
jgi:hypothetical protein